MSISSSIARKLRTVTAILTLGTVADGEYLRRSGTAVVGGPGGAAGIGGSTGATDNRLLRADGAGGATLQNSAATVDDSGNYSSGNATTATVDSAKIGDMAADGYATFAHKDVAADAAAMWQGNAGDTVVNAGGGQSIAFRIANGFSPSAGILNATSFTLGVVLKLTPIAFASLPAGAEGMMAWINDSNTATWGATAAGGGANKVLVVYNGTNWKVAAA